MSINFLLQVGHATVTDLNSVPVKNLVQRVVLREILIQILRNDHPTLEATFLLKGGLYQNDVSLADPSCGVRGLRCRWREREVMVVLAVTLFRSLQPRHVFLGVLSSLELLVPASLWRFSVHGQMR